MSTELERNDENAPQEADVWYFAYGSNLWRNQKEDRTGAIRQGEEAPRIARLAGYRLAFNKLGRSGEVYANVIPEANAEVIGIAYRCNLVAMEKMDRSEGGYERKITSLTLDGGETIEAVTYVAMSRSLCQERYPSREYLRRIIDGARQHGLPEQAITEIERLAGLTDRFKEADG